MRRNMMGAAARRAVALALSQHDASGAARVLGVRRPDDPGDELAGVWGLPAATLAPGETDLAALRRLARDKLGLELPGVRLLRRGRQRRPQYLLAMALYGARVPGEPRLPPGEGHPSGVTYYDAWRWLAPQDLVEASEKGSLCARLYLDETRALRVL